jgi:hypothetical protein
MTAAELALELKRLGVELRVADGKVKCRATAGLISPEIREAMKVHREGLIRMIRYRRVESCQHCKANRWRYEPLAFNGQGGHVCVECKHAVQA